jgi:hypothetical protein
MGLVSNKTDSSKVGELNMYVQTNTYKERDTKMCKIENRQQTTQQTTNDKNMPFTILGTDEDGRRYFIDRSNFRAPDIG